MRSLLLGCTILGGPAALGFAASAAAATAPTAPGDTTALQEVIVTAQKRQESLQTVPVTVSVVNSQLMNVVSTPSIQDLNLVVPGLIMQTEGTYTLPTLRGVSTTLTTLGNEPNVAIYIDGVYYPVSFSNYMRFNDIDHVEVLKGPQGTLFGHNATGGAISIVTKKPSSTPTGDFSVGYGRFHDVEVNGYLSGPITDTLSGNIAVYGHRDSGWARNIFLNEPDAASRGAGVRAKLVYQPSNTFKTTFSIDSSMEDDPPAMFNFGGDSALTRAGAVVASQLGETASTFHVSNRIYQTGASLIVESNHDDFDIVSVSAGRYAQVHDHSDIDNTSLPFVEILYGPRSVSGSEDLRIQSPSSNARLTWVAGLNFLYDDDRYNPLIPIVLGTALPQEGETQTKAAAIYGQATYRFTDRASLTVGGRLSREEVRESFSSATDGVPFTSVTKDWGDFSPKVTLDYQFAASTKGYLTISKGYKGGAFNVGSFQTTPIEPETLWDLEGGLKSDLTSHLRVNVAAFYYRYKDLQVQAFGANAFTPIDTNAPKAKMYGLDADITARYGDVLLGGDTLDVVAGVSVLHSEYVDYPGATLAQEAPGGGDRIIPVSANGNQLVTAPKFTLNFSPSYAINTDVGRFTFTPTVYYNSGYYLDAPNSARFKQKAFTKLNATINWDSPDRRYYVSVWGRNLTSAKQLTGVFATALGPVGEGYPPAWYGVTVGYHF